MYLHEYVFVKTNEWYFILNALTYINQTFDCVFKLNINI